MKLNKQKTPNNYVARKVTVSKIRNIVAFLSIISVPESKPTDEQKKALEVI